MGVGVGICGRISRNNCDPHPARLCFASAFLALRTAAKGRLCPPPFRGRGRTEIAAPICINSTDICPSLALALP